MSFIDWVAYGGCYESCLPGRSRSASRRLRSLLSSSVAYMFAFSARKFLFSRASISAVAANSAFDAASSAVLYADPALLPLPAVPGRANPAVPGRTPAVLGRDIVEAVEGLAVNTYRCDWLGVSGRATIDWWPVPKAC